MPAGKRHDPEQREVRKRLVLERFRTAEELWAGALRAHRLAPPDPGFASRLRELGAAAGEEAAVCREASLLGLAWRAMPGAEIAEPPYELRPGTGRRGPSELWERFDTAVARLNRAVARPDAAAVADAYAQVSEAALALADAVEAEERAAARSARRGRSR